MGAALYIVLNGENPGFETHVDGHALSRADEDLGNLAETLGVAPLMSFFSMNPAEAPAAAAEFDADITAESVGEERWFAPAEGLATVRALIAHLGTHPKAVPKSSAIVQELTAFQQVLEQAEPSPSLAPRC